MNAIPLSHQPITDAPLEVRRGILGKGFTLEATGTVRPDTTTLSLAAKARSLVLASLKAVEIAIACVTSIVPGYVFYPSFLTKPLEDQLPPTLYGACGAAVSLLVLATLTKLFTLYFENLHAHRQQRAQGWTYLGLIGLIAISEAAAIANGLAGQTGSSLLDPIAAVLPYLAGGLLTGLNLGAAWFIGKRIGEGHVIHQAALELLDTPTYQNGPEGVLEARARLRLLQAASDRTHHPPDVTQPVVISDPATAPQPDPLKPAVVNQGWTINGFSPQGGPQ